MPRTSGCRSYSNFAGQSRLVSLANSRKCDLHGCAAARCRSIDRQRCNMRFLDQQCLQVLALTAETDEKEKDQFHPDCRKVPLQTPLHILGA